jgi:ketosteroid isomerase-like protein
VVVVEHRLSATLPNGRSYVNDYCFVYEVRDSKVWRIREYMDTRGGWAQAFGDSEPVQLLEFVVA